MTYGRASDPGAAARPDWSAIDTVLLDLDGTLLDLAFDNHFWLEIVPARFAAAHGIPETQARAWLMGRFRAYEGTLEWYCIEHWSRELGLDVAALKRSAAARICWLPGASEFLSELRARGKRLVLLTNSHPEVLKIKDERTGVGRYMHAVFSSHRFGAPKEDARFWERVSAVEPFDVLRTVFIDDNPTVLRAAQRAGLRLLYGVRRPDSRGPERTHTEFPAVGGVSELI